MSIHREAVLALAGVFQAATLIDTLATVGTLPESSFHASIHSLFELDPKTVSDIFPHLNDMALGINSLIRHFSRHISASSLPHILRYVVGITHLERQFMSKQRMVNDLRQRLTHIKSQAEYFSPTHENVIAALSTAYSATLGRLPYRIQITGKSCYLEPPQTFVQIRALLLAGVRSAVLWRQYGGSRLALVLKRKQIIHIAKQWQLAI